MSSYIRKLLQLSLTESLLLTRIVKNKITIDEDKFKNQVTTITCDNREVTIVKIQGWIEEFSSDCLQLNPFSKCPCNMTNLRYHDGITFLKIDGDELTWTYNDEEYEQKTIYHLSKMQDIGDIRWYKGTWKKFCTTFSGVLELDDDLDIYAFKIGDEIMNAEKYYNGNASVFGDESFLGTGNDNSDGVITDNMRRVKMMIEIMKL